MKSRPAKRHEPEQSPSPFRFRGLWRDEKLLVVDLAEHHFPRRCLKSNQLVAALETITLTYLGPTFAETQLLRDIQLKDGQINIIEASKQRTRVLIELPAPLSPWWRTVWLTPWGRRAIWIGLGVLLSGIVGSQFNEDLGYFAFGLGMLLMLVAAAFQFALGWILPVYRVCEGKIWIGGVHRNWLQRLPQFVPSRTMLAEEIWLLHASLWTCIWFGVFVLGLFLAGRFSGELSSQQHHYFGGAVLTIVAVSILIGNRARLLLQTAKQKLATLDPPPVRRKRR